MARFSNQSPRVSSPLKSLHTPVINHQGGVGYLREAESELFLLAVSNMVGKDTFYESARDRDSRFINLIRSVAATNPDWIVKFIPFLRNSMQMRSASIVLAAEFVKFCLDQKIKTVNLRSVVDSSIVRGDEPAEFIGYWINTFGRNLPQPVKRGISDACRRVYTQYSVQKYDSTGRAVTMADVIQLSHAKPKDHVQSALYRYILNKRYKGNDIAVPFKLDMIVNSKILSTHVANEGTKRVTPEMLRASGWTWERLSSYGTIDWDNIIPTMGYMALLRNLRNFDQSGISGKSKEFVASKLANREEVAKSRQFPLRFLSAYKNVESTQWVHALEQGLEASVSNVPSLKGNTLILVDVSGSMFWAHIGSATYAEQAAVFASALALRAENAKVVAYSMNSHEIPINNGASILRSIDKYSNWSGARGGTDTFGTLNRHWNESYDRVIILTDEQNGFNRRAVSDRALKRGNVYTFNLAGYRTSHLGGDTAEMANSHTFGGLTDAAFRVIEYIEASKSISWDSLFATAE